MTLGDQVFWLKGLQIGANSPSKGRTQCTKKNTVQKTSMNTISFHFHILLANYSTKFFYVDLILPRHFELSTICKAL